MSTKKKKKKKNNRRLILAPIILILIVAVVGGVAFWQLRGVFKSNATTAKAVARTMGNSYSGTVVIARNERLYETENKTSIDFVAAEGSHVSRSGVICKVYSSGYNQTEINRCKRIVRKFNPIMSARYSARMWMRRWTAKTRKFPIWRSRFAHWCRDAASAV